MSSRTSAARRRDHPSVVLADPDDGERTSVRRALEADGFQVVAEVDDPRGAVGIVRRARPDVLVLDLEPPGRALEAISRIARGGVPTLVVVLTASDRPEDVVGALERGASGYLLKGLSGERLAKTLRAALRGEPAVSRAVVSHLVEEIRRLPARHLSLPEGAVTLTPREWQVGQLLREGQSTAEIAARLGLSPITVRRHVGLLVNKLGAEDRTAAVEMLRAFGRR
jgi:DNA-binding NarL/FixJ family response regulator